MNFARAIVTPEAGQFRYADTPVRVVLTLHVS